jgi:hypothetical protein
VRISDSGNHGMSSAKPRNSSFAVFVDLFL